MKNVFFKYGLLLILATPVCFAVTDKEQCEYNGIDYAVATKFVSDLKSSLKKNDKNRIANFISYPLRVNTAPQKYFTINNKKEFVAKYKSLFSKDITKSIRNDNNLFCNYQGAMIGAGVWFNTNDHKAKIFAINK
jgi:hypothetical protein